MRIVLSTQHALRAFIPLALLYLKASLVGRCRSTPADVVLLEFEPDASAGAIADAVVAARPHLAGFSCYVWNIKTTMAAVRLIRARAPGILIVLGGPEVGPVAAEVLRAHPYVDVIVKSEGEVPLADIVAARQAGVSLEGVPGIVCRAADGGIVDTGEAALVKNLDDYPSPHLERYVDYTGRVVCLETQRGCVFQCNFCFYNKDYSLRNRRFDLDRVKQELLAALDQAPSEIYLMDPVFNLNAARAKEICRFVAEHNSRRIPIHSEIWAEFMDDELASLMRQAGFTMLEVGLQTINETALATTQRRLRMQPFIDGVAHLQRHQLRFELQLIFGLPEETRSTFRDSLNFAMSLDPPTLAVFLLLVLPGTELWRKAEALHLEFDPEPLYWVRSHPSMAAADIDYGRRLVAAVNLLERSRTIRLLSREDHLTFADIVDEWLEWRPDYALFEPADADTMLGFVTHLCDARGLPRDFYVEFGAREFNAPAWRTRSATRTTSTIEATP